MHDFLKPDVIMFGQYLGKVIAEMKRVYCVTV